MTLVISFMYLSGYLNGDQDDIKPFLYIGIWCILPGSFIGLMIRLKTKRSKAPKHLLTIYALIAFFMSIVWINFTSNSIMDMLQLIGFITRLPRALFGLTILAWGNCLGDMSADVAMTKKGFGEMAVTGTMAGPIFNILVGQGVS